MERLTGFNQRNGLSFIEGYATYLPGKVQTQLVQSVVDKCRQYEDAEEEGRLIILPCKAGDTLWTYCTYPEEFVYSFRITDVAWLNGIVTLNTDRLKNVIGVGDIGKSVFLTREEAEAALEKRTKTE